MLRCENVVGRGRTRVSSLHDVDAIDFTKLSSNFIPSLQTLSKTNSSEDCLHRN